MTLQDEVEDLVLDTLRERFGLTVPDRWSTERCGTCGKSNKLNLDYQGNPNGYRPHNLAACIVHLKDRVVELEGRLEELERWANRRKPT